VEQNWYAAVFLENRLSVMGPARSNNAAGIKTAYDDVMAMVQERSKPKAKAMLLYLTPAERNTYAYLPTK